MELMTDEQLIGRQLRDGSTIIEVFPDRNLTTTAFTLSKGKLSGFWTKLINRHNMIDKFGVHHRTYKEAKEFILIRSKE